MYFETLHVITFKYVDLTLKLMFCWVSWFFSDRFFIGGLCCLIIHDKRSHWKSIIASYPQITIQGQISQLATHSNCGLGE